MAVQENDANDAFFLLTTNYNLQTPQPHDRPLPAAPLWINDSRGNPPLATAMLGLVDGPVWRGDLLKSLVLT